MKSPGSSLNQENVEGTLRYDINEGWCLDKDIPAAGIRICDLFPDHEGKRVRITVEILPDDRT